jgi:type VI secretion system secreted protein VgrG
MFDPVSEPFFRLDIPNLTHPISVLSFTGTEAISTPFAFELEVVSESSDLDLQGLMYRSAWLSFAGTKVGFNGQIHGASLSPRRSSVGHYRLSLGPRLGCLAQRYNARIFQRLSAPQIIERVLKEHGIHADDRRFELNGIYLERQYCAQYHESDLALVQRLCDEEGIHYHFQHSKRRHVLVFSDSQGGFRRGPSCFFDTGAERINSGAAKPGRPRVDQFTVSVADGNQVGSRALERAEGESTSPYLRAGLLLPLNGHPHAKWNHLWLLTEVQHQGHQVSMLDQLFAADASALPYRNHFRATPWEIGFRPGPPTQRPRMHGVHRARVLGPVIDQEYCDSSGRIRVQFDWGRQGDGAHYGCCWVPVSTALAREDQTGTLPRVGMDVVVSFIQGDPDQPLVTACIASDTEAQAFSAGNAEPKAETATPTALGLRLDPGAFVDADRRIEMSSGVSLTFDEHTELSFRVGDSSIQLNSDCLTLRSAQITFDTELVPIPCDDGDAASAEPQSDPLHPDGEQLLALLRGAHPLILLCAQPSGGSFAHCQLQPCDCRAQIGFDGREAL